MTKDEKKSLNLIVKKLKTKKIIKSIMDDIIEKSAPSSEKKCKGSGCSESGDSQHEIKDKVKVFKKKDSLDLNTVIENKELISFLSMGWVKSLSIIDWGKSVSIPNQYIGRDILNKHMPEGSSAYTTDDIDCPEIDTSNNSPGFDLIIKCPNGSLKRVQSKLRQVSGVTPFSKQIGIETTRRNSKKNENKNHTGHVCYSVDEFDYILVSAVHVKNGIENRHDINKWWFSLVPVEELIDKIRGCCVTSIKPEILNKYKIIN